MVKETRQKRFTVSLDADDYADLRALADGHKPPLKLQYVMGVAVRQFLDRGRKRQRGGAHPVQQRFGGRQGFGVWAHDAANCARTCG